MIFSLQLLKWIGEANFAVIPAEKGWETSSLTPANIKLWGNGDIKKDTWTLSDGDFNKMVSGDIMQFTSKYKNAISKRVGGFHYECNFNLDQSSHVDRFSGGICMQ
jgi:hypothetical protein